MTSTLSSHVTILSSHTTTHSQQEDTNMADTCCSICCEDFNKTTRKPANCRFCDMAFCAECQKRFLLESFGEPACMGCKKGYMREHLMEMLPKSFVDGDLKRHRENILFEREKCLLPETQERIEREKEIKEISRQILALQDQIRLLSGHGRTIAPRKEFHRKCPGTDCNGFLGAGWKCGLCEVSVCKDCLEIKEKGKEHEHVCNPDNVETASLLAKDSKPCPACGVVIFKISGCSQMWCTSCHTAFDWNSGNIEKGIIHNPHFYEYQRQQNGGVAPRVPGDDPCGQANNEYIGYGQAYTSWHQLPKPMYNSLMGVHRGLGHIRLVELPRFPATFNAGDNEDLRRKFLENGLDETKFKWLLQKREKKATVKREIRQVMDMFLACATDILRKSLVDPPPPVTQRRSKKTTPPAGTTEKVAEDTLAELNGLLDYSNMSFKRISDLYGNVTPRFTLEEGKGLEMKMKKSGAEE